MNSMKQNRVFVKYYTLVCFKVKHDLLSTHLSKSLLRSQFHYLKKFLATPDLKEGSPR